MIQYCERFSTFYFDFFVLIFRATDWSTLSNWATTQFWTENRAEKRNSKKAPIDTALSRSLIGSRAQTTTPTISLPPFSFLPVSDTEQPHPRSRLFCIATLTNLLIPSLTIGAMSAARLTKPFRRSAVAGAAAAATSLSLAQMLFLKASYASPPDAIGPREGVARDGVGAEAKPDSPTGELPNAAVGLGPILRKRLTSERKPHEASGTVKIAETVADVEAIVAEVSKSADGVSAEKRAPRVQPRILVIGDSLVSGVGGESSYKNGSQSGPPLPRHIASKLSEKWNAEVQWNTMSLTGGDVRMLSRKILPMLKRENESEEEDGNEKVEFSAVVLVTGVNDWKRMSPFRTPSKFRRDLSEFITKIRNEVGQNCHVFLPAIPGVHHAPRFHYPLRSFLIFINDTWDAQKLALSRTLENVHFVGQPPESDWTNYPSQFFCVQDRLHPSELGYSQWGERIANQIAISAEKGRAMFLNSRSNANVSSNSNLNSPGAIGASSANPPMASSASLS